MKLIKKLLAGVSFYLDYAHSLLFKSRDSFTFQGNIYPYFVHHYNETWKNERTVEVPIVRNIVKKYRGKKILEVGNVLSHYFPTSHDILDKYEKSERVINQDVVDYRPSKKYDLIISISTLEHVGFDEEKKEPGKILRAVENLKNCLAPGGEMVVTLPLGYNPELDKLLKEGKLGFTEYHFMKRVSADNRWVETESLENYRYNGPFPFANGIVICKSRYLP
jgi:SAM-dependent methyltransferase